MNESQQPEKVTGIGGVFFKARDPEMLRQWYAQRLGMEGPSWGKIFAWRHADEAAQPGNTVWSVFPDQSNYFDRPFMINYRVRDLDRLLAELRAAGVTVDEKIAEEENGRFAWITDPEGNRIELWEPSQGN